MKCSSSQRRREFLARLSAVPISVLSARSRAEPKQLKLVCFYPPETQQGQGAQLFAEKIAQASARTIEVSVERPQTLPISLDSVIKGAALAVFCAPCVAASEPVLSLSVLPMIAASFEEAKILLRIARPHYSAALARHGQVLLATQPWLPGVLWSTIPIRSAADLRDVPFAQVSTPWGADEEWGWRRPFVRLGVRPAAFSEAEVVLSSGSSGNLKLTQEFAYFTEIFFAAHLTFLTARKEVFDSLSERQQHVLIGGHDTELALWKLMSEHLQRRQQEVAARGVLVSAKPPADVVAALRRAAEPDIQTWVQSVGSDGAAILAEYRRATGRE